MNALITVKSSSNLDREEIIEVISPGIFQKTSYGYILQYEETKLSGMEGTTTYVKIEEDKFTLEREGSVTTKMEFIKDTSTISLYNTPYGMLDLRVRALEIEVNMNDDGGFVKSQYEMLLTGQAPIVTDITIQVKIK